MSNEPKQYAVVGRGNILVCIKLTNASADDVLLFPLPDDGWRMWPDTDAAWQDDALYLPDEVDLARLPVQPPTGGWQVLNAKRAYPSHCLPLLSSSIGAGLAPAPTPRTNMNMPT